MHNQKTMREQSQMFPLIKQLSADKWRTVGFHQTKIEHKRCLCLIFADFINRETFTKITIKTNLHDRFLLVLFNSASVQDLRDMFEEAHLPVSLDLLAVSINNSSLADVFEVYRVRKEQPLHVNLVAHWRLEWGLVIGTVSYLHRRNDLEGLPLRLGLLENWPISYQVTQKDGSKIWDGFFPTVWRQLEEYLNISTSINIRYTTTGSQNDDGSWSGLIGMAVQGEIDVIVSELTMNQRRLEVLDFSHPLLKSKYQIFFKQPGLVLNWLSVLRPFPAPLWWVIVIWVVGATMVSTLCHYFTSRTGIENRPYPPYGFLNFFYFVLQALSQQGRDEVPGSLACRIVFFSSYLVSAVVIPAYSASLISSLTQKTPDRPFNSINEMLIDASYKLLVPNNTAEYDHFADTKETTLKLVNERLILSVPPHLRMNNMVHGLDTICARRYALFGIEAIVSRRAQRLRRPDCSIISMSQPLSTVNLGMALSKHHPTHPIINYRLGLLIERGVISRIEATSWPRVEPTVLAAWTQLEIHEVFHIFVFLAIATVASAIILLIEKLVFFKMNRTIF